jgi:hypothetical protein
VKINRREFLQSASALALVAGFPAKAGINYGSAASAGHSLFTSEFLS